MSRTPRRNPTFEVTHEKRPSDALLAGFSTYGLAGLTAANYLVDALELTETGHINAEGLPSITPFEDGRPRHPTRLFSRPDLDITILVGELFVPAVLGEPFARSILEWTESNGVSEIGVLAGVPVPHGPEGHQTFFVATDDYREHRLEGTDIDGMGSGFLDGTNAALLKQGLDSPLGVCVYVTPVHAQIPDIDAALRLIETIATVYEIDVDTGPLEGFAEDIRQYYADLAERMTEQEAELPDDRMYM